MTQSRYSELLEIANQTLEQCKVKSYPVSPYNLARSLSITLIPYGDLSADKKRILNDKLKKVAFVIHDKRIIYYDPQAENLQFVLIHEIAHIILGYNSNYAQNEEEATILAYMIAYSSPKPKRKVIHIASLAIIAASILIIFFTLNQTLFNNYYKNSTFEQNIPSQITQPTELIQDETNVVYDTPTGKRYHISKACAGENAFETTVKQATENGKTPCKTCIN